MIDSDFSELGTAFRRIFGLLVFALLPAVLVVLILEWTYGGSTFVSDFHGDLYSAGRAILDGHDPYRSAFLAHLAAIAQAGGHPNTTFAVPVYPAPDLLASIPLALLPYHAAGLIFTGLAVVSLCVGLRLLGVSDWRCYGAAFLSWPVLHTLRLGQVNEFLVLAAAVAWRWRPRAIVSACAVAAAVVAKVFLWPLWLFLVLTRRWRAAVLAVLIAVVALVVSWAVLGFDGFTTYPRMLSDLSSVEGTAGISLISLTSAAGVAKGIGDAAMVLVTLALIGLAWLSLRVADDERSAFGLLVVAGLTSSSLVWPHYLTLLYIPIGLMAPTLSVLWFVPLLAYLAPVELTQNSMGNILPYLAIELIIAVALCRPLIRARRELRASSNGGNRVRAEGPTGRLVHGLRSTSFRSYIAAQRPTKGP